MLPRGKKTVVHSILPFAHQIAHIKYQIAHMKYWMELFQSKPKNIHKMFYSLNLQCIFRCTKSDTICMTHPCHAMPFHSIPFEWKLRQYLPLNTQFESYKLWFMHKWIFVCWVIERVPSSPILVGLLKEFHDK